MNELYKFWMVWIEGSPAPVKKHFTYDEARLEAERLLKLHENRWRIAFILEATSFGVIETPPVIWRTVVPKLQGEK